MPGSAILDPTVLVDDLVPDVIDGLREDLHPQFGIRAYRLFTVLRSYSGRHIGEGSFTDVETEIRPQPLVEVWNGLRFELRDCGVDELGEIRLREVSLTCNEADLIGPKPLSRGQQWLLRLAEAHGQANRNKFFVHTRPPYVDREKDMAWVLWLRSAEG